MKSIYLTPMFSYNKGWVHHTLEEFIENVYLYDTYSMIFIMIEMGSKPLCNLKVDSVFHLSQVDQMSNKNAWGLRV